MATVAELERLSALTKRLVPLAEVRTGALIRADDWNLLTLSVIELARAVLIESDSGAVDKHEHADQVDIDWLTPKLRRLLEQGALSDPVANRRLVKLERELDKSQRVADDIRLNIDRLNGNLDSIKVNDIARDSDLTILRRRFESRGDSRDEIFELRKSLGTIQENLDKTLEIGEQISVNGQLADLNGLFERVNGLENLRQQLTDANGNLLNASTLDIRLAELQTQFVNQTQLDSALEDVRNRPPTQLVDGLRNDVLDSIDTNLDVRFTDELSQLDQKYVSPDQLDQRLIQRDQDLLNKTNEQLDTSLSGLDSRFVNSSQLTTRLDDTATSINARVDQQLSTQLAKQSDELQTIFNSRFVTEQQFSSRMAGFSEELKVSIADNVRNDVDQQVGQALSQQGQNKFVSQEAFDEQVTELSSSMLANRDFNNAQIEEALAGIENNFIRQSEIELRLQGQSDQLLAQLESSLQEQVKEQVGLNLSSELADLQSRVDDLSTLETRINSTTNNKINGLKQELEQISKESIATELQSVKNDLRGIQDHINTVDARLSLSVERAVSVSVDDFKKEMNENFGALNRDFVKLENELQRVAKERNNQTDIRRTNSTIDFTQIEGVGPVFDKRLKENDVRDFSELASMPPKKIAILLDTSEANVNRLKIREQAAELMLRG